MAGTSPVHAPWRCTLNLCSDMIFSSSVPRVMRRKTETERRCPSRWARSIACRSFIGFQSWSRKMTVSAEVRLSPSPPTLVVSSIRSMLGSELNLSTSAPRRPAGTRPSSRTCETDGRCGASKSCSTRSSIEDDCAKTSARCDASAAGALATFSSVPSLVASEAPMPHSSRICLRATSLGAIVMQVSEAPDAAASRSASALSGWSDMSARSG
eukprot:scaffold6308_cov111-Isochrysis_galbana.AAC.2